MCVTMCEFMCTMYVQEIVQTKEGVGTRRRFWN